MEWRKSSFSGSETSCVEIGFDWRKSSYSGTETSCVEIGFEWRKSSRSTDQANCVEIAYPAAAPVVGIRDSKNVGGGYLSVPASALRQLVQGCGMSK